MHKSKGFGIITNYKTEIMGFAALWIYFFHMWIPLVNVEGVFQDIELFAKQVGFCGVDIFFFLSGISLNYAIEKGSTASFYKRRFSRVYLPFVVIAVVQMIVDKWPLGDFLKNISGYHFLTANIYAFLWFVPAIMILYLLFPLYYKLFCKASNKLQFTLLILILWCGISIIVEDMIRFDLYGFTNRIPVFLIGVLVGWSIREREIAFTRLTWLLLLGTLGLGVYFAYKTNYHGMYLIVPASNCCVPNLLIAISGCCLLPKLFCVLDVSAGKVGKGFLRFFRFFGEISLEFYCVQEWLGGKIIYLLTDHCGDGMINLLVFIVVIAAALLLFGICKLIRKILINERGILYNKR